MTRNRSNAGFTLIEILVVLAVMGVVTSMGVTMLSHVSDAWKTASIGNDLNDVATSIFDEMRQDFSATVSSRLAGTSVRGTSRMGQDMRFFKAPIPDDIVVIPAEIPSGPGGRLIRANVTYYVERKNGGASLMRTTGFPGIEDARTTSVKIADGVLALCVEYLGKEPGGVWQKDWNKPAAPAAVRVSVTLMHPVRFYEQIARKAVFPIKVD